jgi:RIO-like serine/threonine protein kinase
MCRSNIFDILKSVHETGVYHDDVCEANIVVNSEGKLRLIDFNRAYKHQCPGEHLCEELIDTHPLIL